MVVLGILRQLGIRVGIDIALISFDDFQLAEILTPSLTVVRQPAAELGRRAAELLFTRMASKKPLSRQHVVLSTTFHIRESCGCPMRREQKASERAHRNQPRGELRPDSRRRS
jgi:LacI family transcriptional regulator